MTYDAFHRNFLELVTVDAETHVHVHGPDRHSALPHVAVASGALHLGADMRGVIELHMRRGTVIINALPLDILTPGGEGRHFLDFGLIRGHRLMAHHAELDARDARHWTAFNVRMAVGAVHSVRQMDLVGVGDWLHRGRMQTEEITNGIGQRTMGRREHGRGWILCSVRRALFCPIDYWRNQRPGKNAQRQKHVNPSIADMHRMLEAFLKKR